MRGPEFKWRNYAKTIKIKPNKGKFIYLTYILVSSIEVYYFFILFFEAYQSGNFWQVRFCQKWFSRFFLLAIEVQCWSSWCLTRTGQHGHERYLFYHRKIKLFSWMMSAEPGEITSLKVSILDGRLDRFSGWPFLCHQKQRSKPRKACKWRDVKLSNSWSGRHPFFNWFFKNFQISRGSKVVNNCRRRTLFNFKLYWFNFIKVEYKLICLYFHYFFWGSQILSNKLHLNEFISWGWINQRVENPCWRIYLVSRWEIFRLPHSF